MAKSFDLHQIDQAVITLSQGGLIVYPTEAVYGLGCDPYNEQAVSRLCALKARPLSKGLILIVASWEQLIPWIEPVATRIQHKVTHCQETVTWIFPAAPTTPHWLTGAHGAEIAIRITQHPIAQALCQRWQGALVSTSANRSGEPAIRDGKQLRTTFTNQVDYFIEAGLGNNPQPSQIRHALSDKIIRP